MAFVVSWPQFAIKNVLRHTRENVEIKICLRHHRLPQSGQSNIKKAKGMSWNRDIINKVMRYQRDFLSSSLSLPSIHKRLFNSFFLSYPNCGLFYGPTKAVIRRIVQTKFGWTLNAKFFLLMRAIVILDSTLFLCVSFDVYNKAQWFLMWPFRVSVLSFQHV